MPPLADPPISLNPTHLSLPLIDLLLREHLTRDLPRLDRLWRYYRNPADTRPDGQPAQAEGLPDRRSITNTQIEKAA